MPTYVYKFTDTGETIEIQQAFTDDALTEAVHPTKGTVMQVKKVFLPVGVTFRGGGFYKTDSRGSSNKSKSSGGDSASDSSSSSDKSSSSDSSSSSDKSASTTSSGSDNSSNSKTSTATTPTSSSSSD